MTTLEGPPLTEAGFFIDRLTDENLHLAGVVANKVIPLELANVPDVRLPSNGFTPEALDEAQRALRTLQTLAARDAHSLADLEKRSKAFVAHVPLMTRDVHDLDGLAELAGYVFGGAASSTRG